MGSILLDRRDRNNPALVYLTLNVVQALCHAMFFTVQLIFQVTVIGLSPLEMVLVGVVLEATCVLFEVPTGVVADVYSRRLSVLIGVALMGCSYTLEGSIPALWSALLSQVFWGLGYTFISGANQAWITDEIGVDAVGPVLLRGRQLWLAGILAGTLLAMLLGAVHIQLPMVLAGGIMLALAVTLTLAMPERRMRPAAPAGGSMFGRMRATALTGARLAMERPVVKVIIAISLFIGLAAEVFDRLSTPSILNRFDFPRVFGSESPVIWFGASAVVGALLGLAATELFTRAHAAALGPGTPARLLAWLAAIDAGAVAAFALSGNLWLAFAMLWVRVAVGAIATPVQLAWLNRHLDSPTRATVISMSSQANSLGQVAGGPALGWVAGAVSIRAALLCSVVVLAPTVALYRRLASRDAPEPASAAAD